MANNLIALIGQPNCGKSTLFNMLTGARQYVANYPGVTVEKNGGSCTINGQRVSIVDLPGTYAFTSYSPEEKAARDFILNDQPNVVVCVVDASSLSKGLYFVLQLLEMGRPVILALNMMDIADRRGIRIDIDKLSEKLGIPVVPIQATSSKSEGKTKLLELLNEYIQNPPQLKEFSLDYGKLEKHTLIFSGGTMFNLTGVQTMWTFYAFCLALVVILGFIPSHKPSGAKKYKAQRQTA